MLLALAVPPDNTRGPQYMEQVLSALHQANRSLLPVTFAFCTTAAEVGLRCTVPSPLASVFTSQLGAHYPDAHLRVLSGDNGPPATAEWSIDLHLRPDLFPIRRYAQFEDPLNRNASDPLTGIFATLAAGKDRPFQARIEITVKPASSWRLRRARRVLRRLSAPLFGDHPTIRRLYARLAASASFLDRALALPLTLLAHVSHADPPRSSAPSGRTHEREDDVQGAADKLGRHVFAASLRCVVSAPRGERHKAALQLHEMAGALAQCTVPRLSRFRSSRPRFGPITPARSSRTFLLSCEELATLWHPATATVRAPAMRITESRELEPPVSLPTPATDPDASILGRTKYRSRRALCGIRPDDRRRHLAILGKTGMGKSTLLRQLVSSDIHAGSGLALLDPHGDLIEAVLPRVPRHRTNNILLFDAGDRDSPPAFNPLSCDSPGDRPLVASGVVSALKKLYGDSWGPRLEHILRNSLLALLELPGSSLLSLQRLLGDSGYRAMVVSRVQDPLVRSFWRDEFARWKQPYQVEAVAPIQNKVGQFLSHPIVRAIVAPCRAGLNLRRVMDEGVVLLVNLSKGRIGEDASALLGALLIAGIQQAAMSRADTAEADRRDFHLFVDEFQNFATDSFATILSEARKYRLTLTVANQYLAQMDEATMAALFGNVGSLLVFQVGAADAETLAFQLGGDLTPRDLLSLPRYTAYVRLLVDGMPTRPFSMETLPPQASKSDDERADIVRRLSHRRYGCPHPSAPHPIPFPA